MRYPAMAMLVLFMGVATGCSISDIASDPHGVKGVDGDKLTHINTRNYAINLFMTKPLWGDASLDATVQSFADEAKKARCNEGANRAIGRDGNVVFPPAPGVHFHPGGLERRGRCAASVA